MLYYEKTIIRRGILIRFDQKIIRYNQHWIILKRSKELMNFHNREINLTFNPSFEESIMSA